MDCDTGFDDLMALVAIANEPAITLVGVSTVVGNTSLANTTRNTLATVELFGITAPVYAGCASPMAQPPQTIESLLGADGLGTIDRRLPDPVRRTVGPRHGVQALIDCCRLTQRPITIMATGPLTNLAHALALAPDIATTIERVVVMGGSADSGNHTAAAEFNVYADPEAWRQVLRSGVPMEIFGLNLTRQVLITPADEDAIRAVGTPLAHTIADHLAFYLRIRTKDEPSPMPLHDPSVAAYLAHPEWFELKDAHVEVEVAGTVTRGATVCEFRVPRKAAPNAHVAVSAQGRAVVDHIVGRMVQALIAVA